jgi:uncharacterized membrane protein
METTQTNQQQENVAKTPYPNLPPLIESKNSEYIGSGNTSTVSIAGHPIHPIIVIFPVAFLSTAAGTDIAYWLTKDIFWARVSLLVIGLGLLTGVMAALVGLFDFFKIPKVRKRTAGWAHMILNVSALVLTLINFGLRLGNSTTVIVPTGILLSVVVASLLGLGGWYGGELTFRHKVGVIGSGDAETSQS